MIQIHQSAHSLVGCPVVVGQGDEDLSGSILGTRSGANFERMFS